MNKYFETAFFASLAFLQPYYETVKIAPSNAKNRIIHILLPCYQNFWLLHPKKQSDDNRLCTLF